MNKYTETFKTWNSIAKQYEEKFMDLDLYNSSYDYFCNAIPKGSSHILELGCGPGNITKYVLNKRPDFNLLSIDVAPKMLELAQANNPIARFETMDVRDIHHLKDTFHGILCGFCLPYLSEKDAVKLIANCHNLLNDNGILYLSFVAGNPKKSHYQEGSGGQRVYFYYHSQEDIEKQLHLKHFEEMKVFEVDYKRSTSELETHTSLCARKKRKPEI